jgi:nitroreductase
MAGMRGRAVWIGQIQDFSRSEAHPMDSSTTTRTQVLRKAASQAVLAPSVHNTQPWNFMLTDDALEIHADRTRQLQVLDPTGRQLVISCGCALFNIRVSLAAQNYEAIVERFPDPNNDDLLARVRLPSQRSDWLPLAALDSYIVQRQTNRRRFEDEPVTPADLYELISAAHEEHAKLLQVRTPEDRGTVARLSQQADALENAEPAYRAELRRWTSDDPKRQDGVPAMAVPHITGEAHDDVPIRDFDTHGMGWLPSETRSSVEQCLLILGTVNDDRLAWLGAGEALQRMWLQATKLNYVASLFTQVIEIPHTRELLRAELGLDMHPHLVMRIGRATRTPASRRRALEAVLQQRGT